MLFITENLLILDNQRYFRLLFRFGRIKYKFACPAQAARFNRRAISEWLQLDLSLVS